MLKRPDNWAHSFWEAECFFDPFHKYILQELGGIIL